MRDHAGPTRTAEASALVQAVAQLPWLAPGAASLAALGRCWGPTAWPIIRTDPGAVLLVVRHAATLPQQPPALAWPQSSPSLFQNVLLHLHQSPIGTVDWSREPALSAYRASLCCARLADTLASRTGACAADQAWTCGLLAPLGWLVASAVRGEGQCALTQHLADGLTRRVARHWALPSWLSGVICRLGLAEPLARRFGTDPGLFHVTRAAIGLAHTLTADLHLVSAEAARDSLSQLGLPASTGEDDWAHRICAETLAESPHWESPYGQPLLLDLLTLAADNARLRGAAVQQGLEDEVDQLHRALAEQVQTETDRVHVAKLEALAEFAAGAGHEINNPLAVISGQAQYLLGHENAWFPADVQPHVRKALQAIVGQTKRMHGLLRDLMLFARPAAPAPVWVDLPTLLGETSAGLQELAAAHRVRLDLHVGVDRQAVYVDPDQVRVAMACLVRNAIEAAPADGWARLVLVPPAAGCPLEVVIEDSGPGPEPAHRPHLFDPFFSGRSAGRGRGLGLPISWRLARQQGGDVRLETTAPGQPTRFVLSLPHPDAIGCHGTTHLPMTPTHHNGDGLNLLAS